MDEINRPVIIAGNWKMYKTVKESLIFIKKLMPLVKDSSSRIFLAVPFTSIQPLANAVKDSHIVIGAQNMNDATEGAFTGEISASMLQEAGAKFVIIGHSERRRLFGESNEFINRKLKKAFLSNLQPILCVGETGQEREEGKTEEVLHKQLTECLVGISKEEFSKLIISYEPVWAIGTDKVATPDEAQAAQQFCRKQIAEIADEETASKISILYGGSVKPDNAKSILVEPDIDGVLVGGASLSVETFSKIVNFNKD